MVKLNESAVAVIILNWNNYEDTFNCLKSLEEVDYKNYHVYLVDNASEDDSYIKLQQDYKNQIFNFNMTLIQSGANLGFAGGNNVAIKDAYSKGFEYIWLLNNDTTVDKNVISPLILTLENDPSIGIVGSKILYYDTNKIWFAGGKVNTWLGKAKHIGIGEEDSGQYNEVNKVDYITGCSLCIRRDAIEKVGFMDESYFLYYEETDWNLRVSKAGYKIAYNPNSIVYHKVSASSGGHLSIPPFLELYLIRNSFWCIRKTQANVLKNFTAFNYTIYKIIRRVTSIFLKNTPQKSERMKFIFRAMMELYK